MKGCLRLFGYLLIIIILISACSAIFSDDDSEKESSSNDSKTEATNKEVYSYDKKETVANDNGEFSLAIKAQSGYQASLKDSDAVLEKTGKGKYVLSDTISSEKENATYNISFAKGDDQEVATIKISNAKANKIYKKEKVKKDAIKNEQELSYAMLNKSQDGYNGKPYHITSGYVMQAMEENGKTFLLVAITNEGYDYYDDLIAVTLDSQTAAVEGDLVEVYGVLGKKFDYDTKMGGTNSVPSMQATSIEVVGNVN